MKVTISNSTLNGKKIDGTYTGNNINLGCPDAQILDDTKKMAGKTIKDVRWFENVDSERLCIEFTDNSMIVFKAVSFGGRPDICISDI